MKIFGANRKRTSNLNPEHHAIVRGMMWISLFVFLGKLAGAAKEMVIAYRYGVSQEVDAYLYVFNLVTWPENIWFSILTFVLIPISARIRQDSPKELTRFRAELLGLTLVLGSTLSLIAWLGLPILLHSSWVGLSGAAANVAIDIMPSMIALIPLGILISLLSAWMLSAGRHVNTLLESMPAFSILVALLVLPHEGAEPLVWGTLAGFILHMISLAIPLAWKREIDIPRFTHRSPQWPLFWQSFGIMLIGQTLMSFIDIIDQFFAAQLNVGAIATLSYANRILALILGLGATAIVRTMLPIFSRIKSQEGTQLKRIAMFWARIMFLIGVISAMILWWLAPWIVKLLFERGAFTVQDTQNVTEILRYGLLQLPFCFSNRVLNSLFASVGKHKLIAISGSVNLFVKTGANFILVPLLGIKGIILATVLMYMVSFVILYRFARTSLK
jgi:putative peptidoglycan lipid II flippase